MVAKSDESKAMVVGGSVLKGWRGVAAGAVAKPIAKRSRFTEDQIKAFIGLALFAYAVYRLARPLVQAARGRASR